jgi:hypothetical protein
MVYRFGEGNLYWLLIEEDDDSKRIVMVCGENITEYEAKEYECSGGMTRLSYGSGSSMPYKNPNGTIFKGWVKVEK